MTIRFTNVTPKPIVFPLPHDMNFVRFAVSGPGPDENGRYTVLGNEELLPYMKRGETKDGFMGMALKPGQPFGITMWLQRLIDMSADGNYTIRAAVRVPRLASTTERTIVFGDEITSNTITVQEDQWDVTFDLVTSDNKD